MVSINFIKDHLWLRSGNSELLIIPAHIVELHKRHDKKEFASYFLHQALLNRPARKLFQSWTRKDSQLWQKIYTLIMGLKFEAKTEQANATGAQETVAGTDAVIEADAEVITGEGDMTNQDKPEQSEQSKPQ